MTTVFQELVASPVPPSESAEVEAKAQELKDEGNTFLKKGDPDEALTKYAEGIRLLKEAKAPPSDVQHSLHLNAAFVCLQKKEWEQAEDHATEALQVNRESAKALFRRGLARMQLEFFTDAKTDFEQALKVQPRGGSAEDVKKELAKAEQAVLDRELPKGPPPGASKARSDAWKFDCNQRRDWNDTMLEYAYWVDYADTWNEREGLAADWRDTVNRAGRSNRTPRNGNTETAKEARARLDWALKELASNDRLHYVSAHGYKQNIVQQRTAWNEKDIHKEMMDLRQEWHGCAKGLRDHEWDELKLRIEGQKLQYVPFHKVIDKPSTEKDHLTEGPYTALRWATVACGGFELKAAVNEGHGGTRVGAMGRDEMREKVNRFLQISSQDLTGKDRKWEDQVAVLFLTALLRKDRHQRLNDYESPLRVLKGKHKGFEEVGPGVGPNLWAVVLHVAGRFRVVQGTADVSTLDECLKRQTNLWPSDWLNRKAVTEWLVAFDTLVFGHAKFETAVEGAARHAMLWGDGDANLGFKLSKMKPYINREDVSKMGCELREGLSREYFEGALLRLVEEIDKYRNKPAVVIDSDSDSDDSDCALDDVG
eukprot:gnl/MRDRNA2_/MRDRNA2_69882_c0_seq1.p1 gnl/MRDRNA2_/MRDRNA2_69882_c0~~gnl/MRDRNA2_/MRDRNA2_69882_c0_seq1.p1  ORF type:complete len:609 (-),score=141.34 gnl/MRDRNA2_/MRDRNA2_69882_c0_seq1:53-1837(-)